MTDKKASTTLGLVLAILTMALLMTPTPAAAQVEKILHNFGSNTRGGVGPDSALIFDAAGDLYGTAATGGNDNVGIVFELSPHTGGGWAEQVLYSFSKTGGDGQNPSDGLIFDSAGNLYGKTTNGGTDNVGTVFELSPPVPPNTNWTKTILHSFSNNFVDGQNPRGTLIFDASGNLYGVAQAGGTNAVGVAYELSPAGGGVWNETLLYTFSTDSGWLPSSGMTFDASGNLYGVTLLGGTFGNGVVYELSPASGGSWTYTILHTFANGTDGGEPLGGLVFDSAGNLYGVTAVGNPSDGGTVFELSPSSGGAWTETIIHNFDAKSTDGINPDCTLVLDSSGALYGTTLGGGTGSCTETQACGIVFQLRSLDGVWHDKILHDFNEDGTDGFFPTSGVILDSAGHLYGTTEYGGAAGGGTVFAIKP
jgi:uncharacterized repeat protein (TIGR03803 family)